MIDILPFNGDGTDGFDFEDDKHHLRNAPTSYHGTSYFDSVEALEQCEGASWEYTNRDPREINLSPKHDSNKVGGDTKWCAGDENGPDSACGYSKEEVTAVRLKYSGTLDPTEMCSLKLNLKPNGNEYGDIYTNNTGGACDEVSLTVMSNDVSAIVPTTAIGDFVWLDSNKDGIQDSDEKGIEGITVKLLDADDGDKEIKSMQTNSNGEYKFTGLNNGRYKVKLELPEDSKYSLTKLNQGDNDKLDSDIDPETNTTVAKDLKSSETYLDFDIGLTLDTVCLGDLVWDDKNRDGIHNDGEDGISGVKIELLNEDGSSADKNATTDSSGNYKFCGLVPAKYKIRVTTPDEYIISPKDAGDDDTNDSDIDPSTKESDIIDLQDNNLTIDVGMYKEKTYSLGDYIWYDDNENGTQDDGELGVKDVSIKLYDNNDNELNSTKTDENGKYQFNNLKNGDYYIEVNKSTLPEGYKFTKQDSGDNDAIDSDINPDDGKSEVTIKDENNLTIDGGIYKPKDPTYSLGDYIWYDNNENGIQDNGESGVKDVSIKLYDSNNKELNSTKTDENGKYEFDNLVNGDYYIEINKSTLPEGYKIINQNQGDDDTIDSDINPSDGKSDKITIKDDDNLSIDGGIYKPTYSIGDIIWYDDNKDGIQDSGESGVKDVSIKLYDSNDKEIRSTSTDGNGTYLFTNLENGDYYIEVNKSTLPEGYEFTDANKGDDDSKDSDINPADGKSETVTVNGKNDLTLDGGIKKSIVPTYSIGDIIWYDDNKNGIQDNEESGVENITIKLYDSNDKELNSTKTDSKGKYEFNNLVNGDYYIKIDKSSLPEGYEFTDANKGEDDSKDSDINPADGKSEIVTVNGKNNLTLDGGIKKVVVTNTTTTTEDSSSEPIVTSIPTTNEQSEEESVEETPQEEPIATEDTSSNEIAQEEEEHTILHIVDDSVEANTKGPKTVIPVLQNDEVNNGVTVRLVNITEGEILRDRGTAVGGTDITTTDVLVVPDEGTWSVENGNIVFTAEDGFTGTPTPIYYIVEDTQGNQSNIAEVAIKTNCVCDEYESSTSDSVASLNIFSMLFVMLFTSIFSLFFKREE